MSLSPASQDVVKATASVVAEHAEQITREFYRDMFEAHPELLRVFNRANQAVGDQPRALAASVVAYAVQLITPDAPDFTPVMQRIAHKHVSLGITAQQYTIVGHHLLKAVGTVLGEAITPDVAAAWDEVYWLFATSLIAQEAKLYALAGTDPEHPWRQYRVTERTDETPDVFSLHLTPVDGALPDHRTGQYVAVAVDLPDGQRQPRQYSISSGPGEDTLRITVKRVRGQEGAPDGQVSTWLAENARPGTVLDVSQPAGDVVLDESDAPLVLISAGIGITPVVAILADVARRQPERTVRVLHADSDPSAHALVAEMEQLCGRLKDAQIQNWYEQDAATPAKLGRMDLTAVELPKDPQVFMCGPLPFMQAARTTLIDQGVHPESVHYEVFGPDLWAQNPPASAE